MDLLVGNPMIHPMIRPVLSSLHTSALVVRSGGQSFVRGFLARFRFFSVGLLGFWWSSVSTVAAEPMPVASPVPAEVRAQFDLSPFYRKHLDAGGFAILSSDKVSDDALREARYIVDSMLAGRDDIRRSMIQLKFRCAVMAPDEFTTDIPEHADLDPKNFWDRRARGLGPTKHRPCVSCGEENLLQYPGDPYAAENILVHEFGHAIHEALRELDPKFDDRLEAVYKAALKKELWKGKYAASNRYEYWGECVQSYFGDNRENDASHNHVNTRPELFEYDPDMAQLIDETFKANPWQYVAPNKRKERLHLAAYDAAKARTFAWPERLKDDTRKRRENRAGSSIEHVAKVIQGWTIQVDIQLLEGFDEEFGRQSLRVLDHKLNEIALLVPANRLEVLRKVTIYLDREHPSLKSMQYHPSADWLRDHGYDPDMARAVHIPRARELVTLHSVNEQPFAVLHELAHAFHDQVLGFDDPKIRAAWEQFKKNPDYQSVLHITGRKDKHYALTDPKEFFAEMTEAFFGLNDFYPFVRGELKSAEPELYGLLKEIWEPNAEFQAPNSK